MSKVIGIDLGTTNSCVAVVEGGKPVVITNAEGERTTPSVVAFTKDGERLVGGAAKRQIATNSGRTISSIKRYMGSDYRAHIDGKDLAPQEISAMILAKIRRDAESYLGESVTEAVITVPAYFDDSQRKATQDAGRIAGLNVLRIINEPTAAAVAYGLDNEAAQKILVYDLGGGTFDVSIIEIEDGTFTVLATGGDTHLGGDDFDQRIVEYAVAEFKKSDRIDLTRDPAAMGRLKEEAEKAKKELSSAPSAQLNLPFIAVGKDGPHHLDIALSRPQFEMMTGDLLSRTVTPVQNALRDAGISASQLGKVLLVGGSTRMPAVERQVRELLGKEPSHSLNPDECVAMGAAVQGALLQGGGKLAGGPRPGGAPAARPAAACTAARACHDLHKLIVYLAALQRVQKLTCVAQSACYRAAHSPACQLERRFAPRQRRNRAVVTHLAECIRRRIFAGGEEVRRTQRGLHNAACRAENNACSGVNAKRHIRCTRLNFIKLDSQFFNHKNQFFGCDYIIHIRHIISLKFVSGCLVFLCYTWHNRNRYCF